MKLTSENILQGVIKALRDQIAPTVDDRFASDATRLATMLLTIVANDVDDAAAARIWENAALRALFADAVELATGDLSVRLAEASSSGDPGYKISELDTENGRLRHLLVELHVFVEGREGAAANALNQRIWKLLGDIQTRRTPRAA